LGGDESKALPAGAAVEVYHVWTLVHDDIIDRDEIRRGAKTVHKDFTDRAIREFSSSLEEARHYGLTLAILAGDAQHAWAVSLLTELYTRYRLAPELVLNLIRELETEVISTLLEGETLDVQFAYSDIDRLEEGAILDMLWKKTGKLYEYCGKTGGMIALNRYDPSHGQIQALASFASKCGLAFQLQDDILGLIGDEATLGKPVGSDLLEGKKTVLIYHAFQRADRSIRRRFLEYLGNRATPPQELEALTEFIRSSGSIKYVRDLARTYVEEALSDLQVLPPSPYKELLTLWARFILERQS